MRQKKLSFSLLNQYFGKYKLSIVWVFFALLFSACSVLAIGITLRYFVNQSFIENNLDNLDRISVIFAGIVLVLALSSAIRSKMINDVSARIAADIRCDLYNSLLSKNVSFFEDHKIADVVSRVFTDIQLIQNVVVTLFSFFIRNTILFLGGILLLFYTNTTLTLYTLLVIPTIVVPAAMMIKKVRISSKTIQDKFGGMIGHVEETLSAIKLVQGSNATAYELSNFEGLIDKYLIAVRAKEFYRSILVAVLFILIGLAMLLVLYLGGQYVINGKMTSGDLVSFIFYSVVVASAAGGMSEVMAEFAKIAGINDRISEIFSQELSEKKAGKDAIFLSDKFLNLEFRNVVFSYPGRPKKVLDGLSFVIKKGEKVALGGDSGVGKSTVVNLIQKFYLPDNGKILINDIDIRQCDNTSVRNLIGVVSQDTFIFSHSVFYNIAYSKTGTDINRVIRAAKIANIHDFIMSLPQKYDTHLGEKGVKLSGGQKQRISIARIIINNPEILLLDEATSNLDEDTADSVQAAIDHIMKGRTTLLISHRSNLVKTCDRVIKINKV